MTKSETCNDQIGPVQSSAAELTAEEQKLVERSHQRAALEKTRWSRRLRQMQSTTFIIGSY